MLKNRDTHPPSPKTYFKIAVLLAGAIYLMLAGRPVDADQSAVKLGYIIDLSAKGAFLGQQSQAGALLAVQDLAAKNINVKIIFEDEQMQAKQAVTAAHKLIEVDKVDAILCDLTAPCTAASPIVAQSKKLFFYQSPAISILAANPYAFKNFLDYKLGCRHIAEYWRKEKVTRVAHFKLNGEFGELCLEGSRQIFADQQVFDYNSGDDLKPLVLRSKSSNVQAIIQSGFEDDFIGRFHAMSDLAFEAKSGMPQPLLTDNVAAKVSPSALNQITTFGFPAIAETFVQRLKQAKLFQSPVSIESAAIAYMHVVQAVNAIRSCQPNDVVCQAASVEAEPAETNLSFKGWKDRIAQYDYKLRKWQNGEFVDLQAAELK
jgi:ABC-type branched-subunit amino acid transport system substrate-binding protein